MLNFTTSRDVYVNLLHRTLSEIETIRSIFKKKKNGSYFLLLLFRTRFSICLCSLCGICLLLYSVEHFQTKFIIKNAHITLYVRALHEMRFMYLEL